MAFPAVPHWHDVAKEINAVYRLSDTARAGTWARRAYSDLAHFYKPDQTVAVCSRIRRTSTQPSRYPYPPLESSRFCVWCASKYLGRFVELGDPPPWKAKGRKS